MIRLKVRKVGNSLGVALPAQITRALHVREGDAVFLTEALGGFRLMPYSPNFAVTMGVAETFLARYRNALRDLAQ